MSLRTRLLLSPLLRCSGALLAPRAPLLRSSIFDAATRSFHFGHRPVAFGFLNKFSLSPLDDERKKHRLPQGLDAQTILRGLSTTNVAPQPEPQDGQKVPPEQLTMSQRFQVIWKKYGFVAVGTYAVVYLSTISSLAALIYMGVDIKGFAETIGLDRLIDINSLDPKAGTFVLAFIATKFTGPIRIPLVVLITPWVARQIQRLRGLPPF